MLDARGNDVRILREKNVNVKNVTPLSPSSQVAADLVLLFLFPRQDLDFVCYILEMVTWDFVYLFSCLNTTF